MQAGYAYITLAFEAGYLVGQTERSQHAGLGGAAQRSPNRDPRLSPWPTPGRTRELHAQLLAAGLPVW